MYVKIDKIFLPLLLVYEIVAIPGALAVILPVVELIVTTLGLFDDQIIVPNSIVAAINSVVSPICKTDEGVPTPVIAAPMPFSSYPSFSLGL